MVQLLLAQGAIVDQAGDGRRDTPLFVASSQGHYQVVELLLDKRANVNQDANDGCTPLISASLKGHQQMVELLLSKGAIIDQPDKEGFTPLKAAASQRHTAVARVLLQHGADPKAGPKDVQAEAFLKTLVAKVCNQSSPCCSTCPV